ncbi:type II secretion system F family protein [uncultured Litoreibacter sp.]|uniref:type II secretion system F family protein n=1 Tax=uncultured Litoreibacter sp. TaxID=1392394 RepID=UPI0026189DAB|nr:type II secretion system F family protein [uncultured Litoreibacter sp.]
MRAYDYIAYTGGGNKKSGTVIAETEAHASQLLKAQDLFVSDLTARARKPSSWWSGRNRLNADLRAVFTRQMAVLLGADLTSEAALEAVGSAGSSPQMERLAARSKAALMEGHSLSQSLEDSGAGFPPYYIAAIRAGEVSGDVDVVFAELADHLENVGADRAQISTALIYPVFVACVSVLVCAILMTSVAPEIVSMFELSGRPLPDLTQRMLAVSDWFAAYWAYLLAVAVVAVVLFALAMRIQTFRNARDALLLRLPVFGRLIRLAAAVQYLRTLALVLTSKHAILSAADSASAVLVIEKFQTEGRAVTDGIKSGQSLSDALRSLSIIPPVARQLISAGEQSAKLARMAERSAVLVENGLSNERKRIAALLEPMLMIVVGGGVLIIVLSVLLPIFDLQSVVSG